MCCDQNIPFIRGINKVQSIWHKNVLQQQIIEMIIIRTSSCIHYFLKRILSIFYWVYWLWLYINNISDDLSKAQRENRHTIDKQ